MSILSLNYRLKCLMSSLYYPAVLGTGLVILIYRIVKHENLICAISDIALYYSALALIFFSVCFLAVSETKVNEYRPLLFLFDVIEVVSIFLIYYFLGLFASDMPTPNLRAVYIVLAVLLPIQWIWVLFTSWDVKSLEIIRIAFILVLIIGAFLSIHTWINILILIALYIFTIWYLINFLTTKPIEQ